MRPADFSNQWLEIWCGAVFLKELAHVAQVLRREAAHAGEGSAQVGGKPLHHACAPTGALLPLHNQPPDVPVEADQFLVDGAQCGVLRGLDARFHLGKQRRVILCGGDFSHRWCEFFAGGFLAGRHEWVPWDVWAARGVFAPCGIIA